MKNVSLLREVFFITVLILVTFLAYSNSFDGDFVFDDSNIYNSQYVQINTLSLNQLVQVVKEMEPSTRPVANLSFALNYYFHKFDTKGYHYLNLLIHVATGLVFYLLLKTTFALPVLKKSHLVAFWVPMMITLVWLVHPVQTQAVSYIVQRMTSLAALFYILSLLLFVRARLSGSQDKKFFLYAGCLFSGLLAMGTKENAVTLPIFIILYEWFFLQDMKKDWLLKNKKYFAGAVLAVLAVSLVILGSDPVQTLLAGYDKRDFTLFERVLTEFRVVIFYISLIFFPYPGRLSLEHDLQVSTSLVSPLSTLPAIVFVMAVIIFAVCVARKHRLTAFCIFWFVGHHLVEGSIIPLELIFEHRNYLPSMMLICLLIVILYRVISNSKVLIVLLSALVVLFSYWTYTRNPVWHDRIALWSDSVQKSPNSARAHNNLAVALRSAGMFDDALFHYKETIRLDILFVEAYFNIGNVLMITGKPKEAVQYYTKAVELNPDHVALRLGLANALFDTFQLEEAKRHYVEALQIEPANNEARANLMRTNRMLEYRRQKQEVPVK